MTITIKIENGAAVKMLAELGAQLQSASAAEFSDCAVATTTRVNPMRYPRAVADEDCVSVHCSSHAEGRHVHVGVWFGVDDRPSVAAEESLLSGAHEGGCDNEPDLEEACTLHVAAHRRREAKLRDALAALSKAQAEAGRRNREAEPRGTKL